MERFRGTWGHVTDQLNELEGLGTWIMPTRQASSLVPRLGNETSKRGADSGNSKAYGEKKGASKSEATQAAPVTPLPAALLWVPDLTCPFVHAKQRD